MPGPLMQPSGSACGGDMDLLLLTSVGVALGCGSLPCLGGNGGRDGRIQAAFSGSGQAHGPSLAASAPLSSRPPDSQHALHPY